MSGQSHQSVPPVGGAASSQQRRKDELPSGHSPALIRKEGTAPPSPQEFSIYTWWGPGLSYCPFCVLPWHWDRLWGLQLGSPPDC
jgi:hypothetical protein